MRVQFAHGQVIQKVKRSRALHRNVIHAMIDQIFADSVVLAGQESDFQLSADAINRTDEHRLTHFRKLKARSEGPDLSKNPFGKSGASQLGYGGDRAAGLVDIHARLFVRDCLRCNHSGPEGTSISTHL